MRILVADKHDLFRQGIVTTLHSLNMSNFDVEEVSDFESLVSTLADEPCKMAVVGINVLEGKNYQSLSVLKSDYPNLAILAVVENPTPQLVDQLRAYDLNGIIAKSANSATYISALKSLMLGGNHIPITSQPRTGNTILSGRGTFANALTRRQEEVLLLLADGKSNKEIAEYLNLSEGTVKVHVTAIFKALDVKNRTQAMLYAQRHRN